MTVASTPTDKLRDALADNIRRVLSGEVEMTDKRFEMLAGMYRSIKATPYGDWIGQWVVVSPVQGWVTLGRLVAIHDTTVELEDAGPDKHPDIEWGKILIPTRDVLSIRIPKAAETKENDR